jgi:small-conductance mechanosensitive channel
MDQTLQTVINIGAIAAAIAALIGLPVAIVKVWPVVKRLIAWTAAAETLPEMALDVRGMAQEQRAQGETLNRQDDKLDSISGEVEKVKQQVKNDHDSNLREDLDAVRDDVKALHLKLDAHLDTVSGTTVTVNTGDTK